MESEKGRAEVELWTGELLERLVRVDALFFDREWRLMKTYELTVEAALDNLALVNTFLEEHLEEAGFPLKAQMQIGVAAEEIYVNIARYTYAPETGEATVRLELQEEPRAATLTFLDSGVPYNPLEKLTDSFRYSDPMSSDALKDAEAKLRAMVDGLREKKIRTAEVPEAKIKGRLGNNRHPKSR